MHRLSCFRDDVIFLIFLYQKWIYRTDYSRVNEYGFKRKDNVPVEETDESKLADSACGKTDAGTSGMLEDEGLNEEIDPQTKKRQ